MYQDNPSLWHVIDNLKLDATMAATDIIKYERGTLIKKRVKTRTRIHKQKLKRLCNQYNKQEKSLRQFLDSLGKSIRIGKAKKTKAKLN